MRAVALSLPRPSRGLLALAAEGELVTSLFTTAVSPLPNHAVVHQLGTHRTHTFSQACVAPPTPAAVSRNGRGCSQRNRSSDGAARTLFSPLCGANKPAPRRSPGGADALTTSSPPGPSRTDALPVAPHPTAPPLTTRRARWAALAPIQTAVGSDRVFLSVASPRAAPAAPLRPTAGAKTTGTARHGGGVLTETHRARRGGGIMSRPVCTAP